MSFKIQFVKCILCIILYIIIYVILLRLKQNSYLTQYLNSLFFAKYNQTKQECSLISQSVIKPINLEIELLEYDEMKGESINLQVSKSLYYII